MTIRLPEPKILKFLSIYYLMYLSESYSIRLKQLAGIILNEGANQDLALNLLKKNNKEDIFNELQQADSSKNNKLLPFMAFFYVNEMQHIDTLKKDFFDYNKLLELKKMPPLLFKQGKIFLGEEEINYIKFSEKVHAVVNLSTIKSKQSGINNAQPIDAKPIFSKEGVIDIYEGHSQQACIQYGQGYPFCISKPGAKMYQSYRDTQTSTFYFVFDRARDKSDPLHIVVVDATQSGILLTDADNHTGNISEYGDDVDEYMNYLSSLGVPVKEVFQNKPKSEEEKTEDGLLGKENDSLEWFIGLSLDYKSKYIGRGNLLTDEQFRFLWNNKAYDLLNQYVNIGLQLGNYQLRLIATNDNLLKSYLRQRLIASEQTHDFSSMELSFCSFPDKIKIIQKLTDDNIHYLLFDRSEEMLGNSLSIIQLLLKYKKEKLSDININNILHKAWRLDTHIEGTLNETIDGILNSKGEELNGNNVFELIDRYSSKSQQDIENLCEKIGVDKINSISDEDFDKIFRNMTSDKSVRTMYKISDVLIKYKTNLTERNILRLLKLSRNKEYTANKLGSINILKLSRKSISELISDTYNKESYLEILVQFKNNNLSEKEIVSLMFNTNNKTRMVKSILRHKTNLTNKEIKSLLFYGFEDEVKNIIINNIGQERVEQIMNNHET